MNMTPFKMTDEQVASIIVKASQLVAEDARPTLVVHMYQMAYDYNENGNSSLFASKVEEFLKKLAA